MCPIDVMRTMVVMGMCLVVPTASRRRFLCFHSAETVGGDAGYGAPLLPGGRRRLCRFRRHGDVRGSWLRGKSDQAGRQGLAGIGSVAPLTRERVRCVGDHELVKTLLKIFTFLVLLPATTSCSVTSEPEQGELGTSSSTDPENPLDSSSDTEMGTTRGGDGTGSTGMVASTSSGEVSGVGTDESDDGNSTSGGPTVPGWPDASNTGIPDGTRLVACASDIMNPGVYEGCQFGGIITLYTDDVTIRASKIDGVLRSDLQDLQNVVLEDVEIDSHDELVFDSINLDGYTARRLHVHDSRKCFGGRGMTVEDSYCHDLHGEGDPQTDGSHNEAILASGDRPIAIRHNTLVANWNATSTGGGMSAVIAIYAGGVFGPLGTVSVENNRIENSAGAVYCMYSGQAVNGPTGISVLDNLFIRDGCENPMYRDWVSDPGNAWSGNTYDDGAVIPEPASQG